MSAMIARYLKDFGAPAFPVGDMPQDGDGVFGFAALPEPEPEPDPETIRRMAYAEGHEAATAELSACHAEEVAALEERHAAEIAAVTGRFEEQFATMVSGRLPTIAEEIARSVTEATAQAILPFVGELVARKAVSDLSVLLKGAIEEGEAGRIRLRGPASLFRRLADLMGDRAAVLDFEESDDIDLTAEMGSAVLMTRLGVFASGLEKVME